MTSLLFRICDFVYFTVYSNCVCNCVFHIVIVYSILYFIVILFPITEIHRTIKFKYYQNGNRELSYGLGSELFTLPIRRPYPDLPEHKEGNVISAYFVERTGHFRSGRSPVVASLDTVPHTIHTHHPDTGIIIK